MRLIYLLQFHKQILQDDQMDFYFGELNGTVKVPRLAELNSNINLVN